MLANETEATEEKQSADTEPMLETRLSFERDSSLSFSEMTPAL